MLNDYTRGGQLFLHKIRMLRQVWDKTLFGSFIVSSIVVLVFSYKKLLDLDYPAGITYVKAHISEELHGIFSNKTTTPKITAVVKDGIYAKNINARTVINHPSFKRKFNSILAIYFSVGLNILYLTSGILFFVIVIWSRVGSKALQKNIIKGSKILTAREVAKILKKQGKDSHFKIGDMPLVKDKETSHILITGTTGSGKSNCMHNLLPQIRQYKNSAIIVDLTGEMVERYYDPKRGDVILSPFDKRGHSWDFWQEVSTEDLINVTNTNLDIVSKALFARDDSYSDPFWQNSAEIIFNDVVTHLLNNKKKTIRHLNDMLAKIDMKSLASKLKDTYSTPYLDPNNEKTAASIRSTLATTTKSLRYLNDKGQKQLALKDWVDDIDSSSRGKWLFLYSAPEHRELMKPLISVWLDIIVNKVMSLGVCFDRRIWLIIDELAALKKMPSFPTAVAEFRKYGGCIIAGIQSANQLYKIYGQNEGLTLLDQFNTKFVFRTEENNFANYICKNFGEIEYEESSENFSYGAHEMRDGVSFSKLEKKKPLVTPADLASLADKEAYVKLPEPSVRAAKISMKYITPPINQR